MRFRYHMALVGIAAVFCMGANESSCSPQPSSNDLQRDAQERILAEGNAATGMPAIRNFREKKLLKDIYEMRDQASFITYSYLFNEMQGKFVFLCQSIGYPIPYATEYTAPEAQQRYTIKDKDDNWAYGTSRLPQADPNGLFSPASADGTWVLCKDPNSNQTKPVYVEPKVTTSPFKLDAQ